MIWSSEVINLYFVIYLMMTGAMYSFKDNEHADSSESERDSFSCDDTDVQKKCKYQTYLIRNKTTMKNEKDNEIVLIRINLMVRIQIYLL